jgi:ABC-type lipoprotein export system ATPase subunit
MVTNFGSYKHLEFDFNSNGLTLISGPTGSGKSTLCDIVPWILFGRTSKGGAVDEVRSWDAEEATTGTLMLHGISITRSRKPNDLTIDGRRGKDLNDTQ